MTHDLKTWEEFNKALEETKTSFNKTGIIVDAYNEQFQQYLNVLNRLKPKGSNLTPPKKKRKKKEKPKRNKK